MHLNSFIVRSLQLVPWLLLLPVITAFAAKDLRVTSPNGRIIFVFQLTKDAPAYRVLFDGKPLVDASPLTLTFAETGSFGANLISGKPVIRTVDEPYELVVGKARHVRDRCREVLIPLVEPGGARRQVNLVVRVYDDGVAFRYAFPKQPNWSAYTLTDERSTFRLAGDPVLKALFLPNYVTSHEGLYTTLPLSTVKPDTLMDMPALFMFPGNRFLAITEAALTNYAGMYLTKRATPTGAVLTSQLSPLPGQGAANVNTTLVRATLPHQTPWRVLLISDHVGAFLESTMLTSLNEPSPVADWSWLKSGKASWPWWNGNVTPDTSFAPGNNFETNQYYIDFCAANHIEFHSIVEYGLHEWYVNDGAGFMPGPHADPSRAVPGLDMPRICAYAKQKGVKIRFWTHWGALYPKLEQAFAQYEQWGVAGLMVDFMDRDDQEMVAIQEEILRSAARHKLHIQFHGAYKPTGRTRTYPNEFAREGTLNYETAKWSGLDTPDHDLNMAFTRLLAGPADMHLGGFRAVPDSAYRIQYTRPLMHGTRSHQLAMYVVFESYLQLVSDYPDAYRNQPGFAFIRDVPTTWDETRVPAAEVDEYAVVARRSGADWYVGAINNHSARTLTIKLDFLPSGTYEATIYADAPDVARQPNHLTQTTRTISPSDTLTMQLAAGGGQAIQLKKL